LDERIILRSLIKEETYVRRVLPFINEAYFQDRNERVIFTTIRDFIEKYGTLPSREALIVGLDAPEAALAQDQFDEIRKYLADLTDPEEPTNEEWLVENTESWCQDKALHNALLESISIMSEKKKQHLKGTLPKLLQDALAVSFDPHVGHDYIENKDDRYAYYHKVEQRLPFHLDTFNEITKNGIPRKTLNIILAGTGVGKSLVMCDFASQYFVKGKNVLYITLEMAEERIAERIDANLLDVPLDELFALSKEGFDKRLDRINAKGNGNRFIIKEYPTATAHVGHFRHVLNELYLKKQFKPDVIFIDYLNICASSRMKVGGSGGMYEVVKSIAEELRGLAVEFDVPIWSATQMNRSGFANSDPDLTNTSESFGLPATADFMFALVATEELNALGQIMVKILKNRFGDLAMKSKLGKIMTRFVVGIDRSKMKLFNLDPSAQDGLNNTLATSPTTPPAAPNTPTRSSAMLDIDAPVDQMPWDIAPPKAKVANEPLFDIDTPMNADSGYAAETRRNTAVNKTAPFMPGVGKYQTRNRVSG